VPACSPACGASSAATRLVWLRSPHCGCARYRASRTAFLVRGGWSTAAAGAWGSGGSGAGPAAVPGIALICGRASPACRGDGSRLAPHCRSLHSGTGSAGTLWPGAPARAASCLVRRRARRAKLVHSGALGRLGAGRVRRAQQGAAAGPRAVSADRAGLPPWCRASTGGSKPTSQTRVPIVWSSMIMRRWPAQAGLGRSGASANHASAQRAGFRICGLPTVAQDDLRQANP
jgi:hypothetical protein